MIGYFVKVKLFSWLVKGKYFVILGVNVVILWFFIGKMGLMG